MFSSFCCCLFVCFFKTGFLCVALTDLKLSEIHLSLPPSRVLGLKVWFLVLIVENMQSLFPSFIKFYGLCTPGPNFDLRENQTLWLGRELFEAAGSYPHGMTITPNWSGQCRNSLFSMPPTPLWVLSSEASEKAHSFSLKCK